MTKKNAIFILLFIGATLYLNSLFNGFVWDDEEQIVNNSLVHSIANWPKFFLGGAFNSGGTASLSGIYYKPLMTLTFSLIYSLFGSNPFFFHLASLTIHLANAVGVFLLFDFLLAKIKKGQPHTLISLLASLIFLVHPLYSEVVLYAANMQDILYFFFGISGFLLSIIGKLTPKRIVVIFFLLLSSLLSKETGIVFAGLTVLYYLIFRQQKRNIFSLLTAAVLGIYLFLRLAIAGISFSRYEIAPIAGLSLGERLTNIPKIILYYLQTIIVPSNLAANQHWVVSSLNFYEFYLPLAIFIFFVGIIVFVGYLLRKRSREHFNVYLFYAVWFFISLIPHLQIFPLDVTASGRWFYLPMVGLVGMATTGAGYITSKKTKFFKPLVVIIGTFIFLLSIRTFVRTFDWRNGLALYSHDAEVDKNNFNLENNLGVELFRNGKYEEAEKHFENSVNLAPHWWTNWNNLGAIKQRDGDMKSAQEDYQKAIDNGGYYLAYENLANLYFNQGKLNDGETFIKESLKALPENPKLWLTLALTQYKLGKKEDALIAAKNAYLLAPSPQTEYVYSRLLNGQSLELK